MNIKGIRFQINSLLKKQLDVAKKMVRQDFDMVVIVDGEIEGTGKSVLAQQCALYVDPTFNINRVVFSPEEFRKAVLEADKYQAIIWDEAYEGTSKFRVMSGINQMIRSLLRQIRQKNLFIFIVIPAFTDLDYDIAVRRSWFLLRAELDIDFETEEIQRGNFTFYSRKKKKWLYYVEANRYDIKKGYKASNSFVGFFNNVYGVDKQSYLDKKGNIKVDNAIDDRTFLEACFKRGMPVKYIRDYVNYNEKYLYTLRKQVSELS